MIWRSCREHLLDRVKFRKSFMGVGFNEPQAHQVLEKIDLFLNEVAGYGGGSGSR